MALEYKKINTGTNLLIELLCQLILGQIILANDTSLAFYRRTSANVTIEEYILFQRFGELIRDYSYSSRHAELGFLFGRNSMGTCATSSRERFHLRLTTWWNSTSSAINGQFRRSSFFVRSVRHLDSMSVIFKLNSGNIIQFSLDIGRWIWIGNLQTSVWRARKSRML